MASASVLVSPFQRLLRAGARATLDALLPPRCLACAEAVDAWGRLCVTCWSTVDFIAAPLCTTCGLPLATGDVAQPLCGGCARARPAFDRARAAMAYGDVARRLVTGLKHGDRTYLVPTLAAWIGRAGRDLLADADAIAPVPLHRLRLARRRFNQSALLANRLAQDAGIAACAGLLVRRRWTRSQSGLSRTARRRNLAGAIAVRPRYAEWVRGRRVVIVDDVLTTGATVEACARALRRAGAAEVRVLTLARVVRETS